MSASSNNYDGWNAEVLVCVRLLSGLIGQPFAVCFNLSLLLPLQRFPCSSPRCCTHLSRTVLHIFSTCCPSSCCPFLVICFVCVFIRGTPAAILSLTSDTFIFTSHIPVPAVPMPPASTAHGTSDRARLHAKFATAATALADLYRESSNAYEAGYRDALLFVQRYLQPSTTNATNTNGAASPSNSPAASTLGTTLNAAQMMRFLQDTVAARRERMAAVRGVHSMRRRQRDASEGVGADMDELEEGERELLGLEGEEEEEHGLTPQSSPAVGPAPPTSVTSPSATATGAAAATATINTHSALNHDMELITLLEPPVQPHRQRRRTDRHYSTPHRRVRSPRGHPFSLQLPVGRGK